MTPRHLLILGGTAEAAGLASAVSAEFGDHMRITISLAGRTQNPAALAGTVRIGGFGGVEGLTRYLITAEIDLVIDATHPFAAAISAHAVAACAAAGRPRLRLNRPPWAAQPGDRWILVDDIAAAARALPLTGTRAFVTVGRQEIQGFAGLTGIWLLIRAIEPPPNLAGLGPHQVILERGPFYLADERLILQKHAIDVIVTKASGGTATEAKLEAARAAGLPVIMIRRPPPPPGSAVETIDEALAWLRGAIRGWDG